MLKKILTIIVVMFVFASMAFGDEVDEGLTNMATEQVRTSTRQMISSGVNKDEAIRMTRLMLENRFRNEQVLRAHEIIRNAKKEGLPEEPIMSKAFEGMTKHIEERNVIRAMEAVRSRYALSYEYANKLTKERAQKHQIGTIIAECFAGKINNKDMEAIMQGLQQRTRTEQMTQAQIAELAMESFRAARDMTRLGVSSKAVTDVVCQALQHHYSAREMNMMNKSFMTHSRYSAPNSLAQSYFHSIERGIGAEGLGASDKGGFGSHGDSDHGGSGAGHGGGHK